MTRGVEMDFDFHFHFNLGLHLLVRWTFSNIGWSEVAWAFAWAMRCWMERRKRGRDFLRQRKGMLVDGSLTNGSCSNHIHSLLGAKCRQLAARGRVNGIRGRDISG